MNEQRDPRATDRQVVIAMGTLAFAVTLGVIFYQVGYTSGQNSTQTNDQQSVVYSPDTKPAEDIKAIESREPITLSGVGQQASKTIDLKEGLATVKMSHAGDSHFSIWVLDKNGDRIELLVNETGHFDGSKAFKVPADGSYILDISADGAWKVDIQQ